MLVGCGKQPTVTLVLCKQSEDGTKYYYDTNDNYYWLKPGESTLYPINDIGLKTAPALVLSADASDYSLEKVNSTRYLGTFDDVSGYIHALESEGFDVVVKETTPALMDATATSPTCSVRVVYVPGDCVRVYSIDDKGAGCEPPLL